MDAFVSNEHSAEQQRLAMLRGEPTTLYLTVRATDSDGHKHYEVTDFPGINRYEARRVRTTRMYGGFYGTRCERQTAQFIGPDGALWWIDVRGDMTCGTARRYKKQ